MSTSPPPKRRLVTASNIVNTETSNNTIPKTEQQEIDQTFTAKVETDCNFSHPEWRRNEPKEFPPGYRFCPYDDELIVYYLQKKIKNEPMPYNRIQDVNLYMHNPQYLADEYQVLGDDTWYFFSPRDRKYRKGKRPKRAAGEGYWKATGADKPVDHQGKVVGKKKSLVFYLGKPPNGDKTDWIMQEYTVEAPPRIKKDEYDMRLDDWVLCKIYKKAPGKPKKVGQEEVHRDQMADAVASMEEEVTQGTNCDDHLVGKNYDHYNMSSGYIAPPSRISAFSHQLLQFSEFSNYNNFAAYHPQQQVVNYQVPQFGNIPPLVHPTQAFIMSNNYNIQDNIGSISTTDNRLAPQLPQRQSVNPLSYYNNISPNNPPPPPRL